MLLTFSQNSQESTCVGVSFLKKLQASTASVAIDTIIKSYKKHYANLRQQTTRYLPSIFLFCTEQALPVSEAVL